MTRNYGLGHHSARVGGPVDKQTEVGFYKVTTHPPIRFEARSLADAILIRSSLQSRYCTSAPLCRSRLHSSYCTTVYSGWCAGIDTCWHLPKALSPVTSSSAFLLQCSNASQSPFTGTSRIRTAHASTRRPSTAGTAWRTCLSICSFSV